MANNVIDIGNLGKELDKALEEMLEQDLDHTERSLRGAYISFSQRVILKTPVDRGAARANWLVTKGRPTNKVNTSKNIPSNAQIDSYLKRSFKSKILGKSYFLTNNLPYIEVLEFGLYPKNPEKGTYNKKRKKYQIRSKDGFSKQAPKGMVRTSIKMFDSMLRKSMQANKR